MVVLNGWADYTKLFVLAAVLGSIGGLTFELLQTVRGRSGLLERRGPFGKNHYDLGYLASMIVGAVAAVAAIWVFPPEVKLTVAANGATTTTNQFDIVKVVGLSLIIGSAGGSFLVAMQARALALVKTEQAAQTKRVATGQLDEIEKKIESGATSEALAASVSSAKSAIAATGASSPNGNPLENDF